MRPRMSTSKSLRACGVVRQIGDEMRIERVAPTFCGRRGGVRGAGGRWRGEVGTTHRFELHRAIVHEHSPRHNHEEFLELHRTVAVFIDGRNHIFHLETRQIGTRRRSLLVGWLAAETPRVGQGRWSGAAETRVRCGESCGEWAGKRSGARSQVSWGRRACTFVAVEPIIRIVLCNSWASLRAHHASQQRPSQRRQFWVAAHMEPLPSLSNLLKASLISCFW